MCRFTYAEIKRICTAMNLKPKLKFNTLQVKSDLALAMIMFYYSFPRRQTDMVDIFGMSKDNVSRVVSQMSRKVFEIFQYGIEFDEQQFSRENLERFSKATYEKGTHYPNIVGFVDGTMQ
ncbi:hypothetical protein G6F56_012528 [Rhizopus delemar]|nr:hypothetical protein G6F56_012528 [Rhizopus delemar]